MENPYHLDFSHNKLNFFFPCVQDSLNLDDATKSCKQYTSESSSYFLPQVAIGFFSSIAVSLFGSHGSTSLSIPTPSVCISEVAKESGISHVETHDTCTEPHSMSESETFGNKNLDLEGEEIERNGNLPRLKDKENTDQFRQFDMVADCADHHFYGASKELALSQVRSLMRIFYKHTLSYIHSLQS